MEKKLSEDKETFFGFFIPCIGISILITVCVYLIIYSSDLTNENHRLNRVLDATIDSHNSMTRELKLIRLQENILIKSQKEMGEYDFKKCYGINDIESFVKVRNKNIELVKKIRE